MKGDKIRISNFRKSRILKNEPISSGNESELEEISQNIPSEKLSINYFRDEKIPSPAQDIWDLGIIAHQLYANGSHPFNSPNSNWMLNLHEGNYIIDPLITEDSPLHQIIKGN